MTRPIERTFTRLHPAAVRATRDLVKARPWRKAPEHQLALAEALVARLSGLYGIEAPALRMGPTFGCYGYYVPAAHTITLDPRFSIITLLHEWRHAYQARTGRHVGSEPDARAWSLSLFRTAAPRRFALMAAAGRILHLDTGTPAVP